MYGTDLSSYSEHYQGTDTFKYYLNSESIKSLKSWGVNVIRFGLEIEQVQNTETLQDFLDTVDLLIENDIYVLIVLWNNESINENISIAEEYFEIIAEKYADSPNILYEIANEPDSTTEWIEIRDYSNTIIPIIRNHSNDSIIIIPNPRWDNRPDLVNLSELCETSNIMTSYHMYVGNGLTKENMDYLQEAINNKIPVFVTEWGTTLNTGNDGFYEDYSNAFVKIMDNLKLSWCNFHISDFNFREGEGRGEAEYSGIVKHSQWNNSLSDDILTASGKYIKSILQGKCNSYNNNSYSIMMTRDDNEAFWQEEYRNKIVKIEFKNENTIPEDSIISWDISLFNKDRVYAYIIQTDDSLYELYIISNTTINLPIYTVADGNVGIFENFSMLQSIKFDNISTYNCREFSGFFRNCSNLENIEGLSIFNTSNAEWMYNMFNGCKKLTNLNLRGWNTSKVYGMTLMFADCSNLTEIIGINDWNVSNVAEFNGMFQECTSIKDLNLANWDMKNTQRLDYTFFNLNSLENLYLNNVEFNTEVLGNICEKMFGYVTNEANIYVKDENVARFIYNNLGTYPEKYKIYYGADNNWTEYTI